MSTADISHRMIPSEHPDVTANRHAKTLDEIRSMQQSNILLTDQVASLERERQALLDRVELLLDDNRRYKRESRTFMGKMMELATAMTNMGLLARKGEEVVLTTKELLESETDEQAEAEKKSAADAVRKLPMANVIDQVERDLAAAQRETGSVVSSSAAG